MASATAQPKDKKEDNHSKEPLEKAKDAGAQAAEKAKEAVASMGEMAQQTAAAVGKKADDLTATAGADIQKLGDTIGEKAPHEGVLGKASQAVAHTLQEGGKYMEEAKLSGMAEDLTRLIRQNPIQALL